MQTYEFTATFLERIPETDEALDRLFEAGLDDASLSTCDGVSQAVFHREAASLEEAIDSAIRDVEKAGFHVARIESDEFATILRFNDRLQASAGR